MPDLPPKSKAFNEGGLLWGATNSGKSWAVAHHAIVEYVRKPGDHMLLGSNIKLLNNAIVPLIQYLCRGYGIKYGRYNKKDGIMPIGNGRLIIIACKNEGDQNRIRTYHHIKSIWGEEVSTLTEEIWDMAVSRCDPGMRKWATCNPTVPISWVKKRIDEPQQRWGHDDCYYVRDNASLTPEEVEEFESQFSGVFAERMIHGRWVAPEGLMYPNWKDNQVDLGRRPCYIGVDYGESNITCCHYAQMNDDGNYVVTKEYYYNAYRSGHKSPAQHALSIQHAAPGPIVSGWIDPTAKDLRAMLRKLNINIYNANTDKDGYNITDGMLQRGKLQINSKACPELNVDIQSLIYNKYGDAPDPNCRDHGTDDLRYLATGLWEGRSVSSGGTQYR